MISTTAAFNAQIQKDARTFRARLLSGNIPINGEIKKIIVNKGACGESFSIGSIYSSYIEVTLDECEEILENKELLLQIGLVIDDTVEHIDMGYYTVTKPSRSTYQTTFTAVGRITSKLNCLPTLPAEQTLAKLAAAITEATGVQIICKGVALAGTIEEDLTGLTCREILEVITAVLGGFATEDNAGNIVISKFYTADLVHFNGERTITDPEFSDYDYELTGVKVTKTEEWTDEDGTVHPEVSFTEGTPRQTLSMKYMTESLFSAFKANVVGYTYRPGTIPLALGDPRLDPWDCILYADAKGNAHVVPCLSIVHTFDGGLSTVITAPGESESGSESQVRGPLVQQVERVAAQIFTAEQAILKRITADEADLRYAAIASLTAVDARITNLAGDYANFKNGEFTSLKSSVATIEKAYVDEAKIEKLIADKGYITKLETNTLLSDYVKTDTLKAGYITATEINSKYATITSLDAKEAEIKKIFADYVKTEDLVADYIKATDIDAKYATIKSLEVTDASVDKISGDFATFKEGDFKTLQVNVAKIDAAYMDEAKVNTLVANKGYLTEAQVDTLVAGKGYITELETNHLLTDYAKVTELNAVDSKVTNLDAKAITTDNLSSKIADFGFITVAEVSADYATIKSLGAAEAQIESLSGEFGTFKSLTTGQITAIQGDIQTLDAGTVKTAELESKVAEFGYAKVTELESEAADIRKLFADYATVSQLNVTNGNIMTLSSTVAEINSAYMDEAEVESLVVGKGYLSEAQVNALVVGKGYFTEAQVNNLVVGKGYITTAETNTLLSNYVKTTTLTADYIKASDIASIYATIVNLNAANARIDGLNTIYATIDLANVKDGSIDSAMIGDGVVGTAQIADGSITDAKIVGLTANKITAGKLDAGVIEVVNLNAANITVGTINGQQIASGAIDTSKLTNSLNSTITSASTNASKALTDAADAQEAADKAQATADKSYEKVNSKGEQLIVNGNAMMGNNTNFSSWTFDGAVGNNSPGSFTRAAGSSGTLYSDEYFLVSTNNTYTFSFDVKSLLGAGTMYSFIMFYDVDKNTITAPNHMYHPGSTTTLAKDLKAGDTVIYLIDASGWSTSVSYGFYLTIWNYKNSKGYTYPPESYTRNRVTLPKTSGNTLDSSKINYTDNTITLASAYSGSTIPAGTSVSQGRDGGTYKYTPITGVKIPTVWTTYTGKVGGVDYSGTNKGGMFPPGVAYARIGFLWNYNKASGEQQWITNITVTDTTAVDKAQTTADGKNTVFYQESAPSTSGRKTNDVWFDTDDGNKMYYWNGSAWAAQQFSTSAIAANAITAEKITSGAITAAKIASNTITAAQIASGAIAADELAANAVTAAKIAADSVTTEKIAAGAVVADSIASSAITADKIVAEAVTADKIAVNAVTANKILAGSITTDKIAASAVTANKLSVDTLSAITANLGTVTAGVLQSENYQESDYSVGEDGTFVGSVLSGVKIDLNGQGYYTPQIAIKDDYIKVRGFVTVGERNTNSADGNNIIGKYSLAVGYNVTASGTYSMAIGADCRAYGDCSFATGAATAEGQSSFATGFFSRAYGDYAHAEGWATSARGGNSHSEGGNTTASGHNSHSEGEWTYAYGRSAHVEGLSTEASSLYQHVQGKYNIIDGANVYAHIVGNGTGPYDDLNESEGYVYEARANAHTLDWSGNAWYAGDVIAGGTQATDGTVTGGVSLKKSAPRYIVGTGTTAGTWLGTDDSITEYFDGLTVLYKVGIAGASTTTLNINGLGAVQVMRNASSAVTTHYGVNSIVLLTYTTDDGTGYWKIADYDANNYAYVRQYYTTADGNYPLLSKYDAGITTTTNYVTKYSRYSNKFYINPSTGVLTAPTFKGELDGNAATATKSTHDGDGNVISSTYSKTGHTHSYLPLSGGTLTGELLISTGTTQSATKGIKWSAINSKNPYIGYATDQVDGTFVVGSLLGTNYASGLAIGGGSGNLLWKGSRVATVSDLYTHPSYTARTGVPTANATLSFGGTFTVSQPVSDATGHITAINSRTYTMPSDRLFTTLVPTGTAIPANADLNTTTYLKVGRYYCSSNANAATLKNCPMDKAFMMEVYSPLSTTIDNESTGTWVYRLRKITHYNTGVQYVQYCYAGATAGTWTYGNWYIVPRSPFTMDSSDTNSGSATLGSTTKPVYVASDGTLTGCSTYAGGTAVTLNGSSKAASTASFYAPTAVGTSGNVLVSAGSGAPTWKSLADAGIAASGHTHSYLPLSGGTITGALTLPNATALMAKNSSGTAHPLIYLAEANNLTIGNPAAGNPVPGGLRVYTPNGSMTFTSNGGTLQWYAYANSTTGTSAIFNTSADNIAMLGSSSYRWYRLYQTASSISTSDEREKSNIRKISEYPLISTKHGRGNILEQIFNDLVPKTYTLDAEKKNDVHIGFVAQDIEKTINKYGLTVDDLGIIDHEYWIDEDTGQERDRYGLAYEEFTALNTYILQKQQSRVAALERYRDQISGEVRSIRAELISLQNKLNAAMMEIAEQEKQIEQLMLVS